MRILYQQRRSVYVDNDWSCPPGYEHTTKVAMFDNYEAPARQIREVIQQPSRYDVQEWNRCGDEILVEPGTAEGCMWYGMFHKGPMYEVMKAYTNADSLWQAWSRYCRYKNDDSLFEDAIETLLNYTREGEIGKRIPYIEYSVADETIMRAAQTLLPAMKWYWSSRMLKVMSDKPLGRSIQFDIDHGRDDSTRHMFSVIHDNGIWNAMTEGMRINETIYEREHREALAYFESEEGQAEAKAERERHNEMMTYMGESGLNSYSIDDEGRYHMWRD